jgi:hypothetical protein
VREATLFRSIIRFTYIILLVLASGCATNGTVHVSTLPAGGHVVILETGSVLADGQTAMLPAGNYTLRDGSHEQSQAVSVELRQGSEHSVVIPVYVPPQVKSSLLTVQSNPPGAIFFIQEIAQDLVDGQSLMIPAGVYTIQASLKGYSPPPVTVVMDGQQDKTVIVPLGIGRGTLHVTGPSTVEAFLDGRSQGKLPLTINVEVGRYQLLFRGSGFDEQMRSVEINPGETLSVTFVMPPPLPLPAIKKNDGLAKPLPLPIRNSGPVSVVADASEAVLYVNGRHVGKGRIDGIQSEFGRIEGEAILQISEHVRRYGKNSAEHYSSSGTEMLIPLHTERLFDGQWMSEQEALAAEQADYLSRRVGAPVSLRCHLDDHSFQMLRENYDFPAQLHAISRIGDRIILEHNKSKWIFWKRSKDIDPDYKIMAESFFQGNVVTLPWKEERTRIEKINSANISDMAFAIHKGRGDCPLLSGTGAMHGQDITVKYAASDSGLTVLVDAKGPVEVHGVLLEKVGDLLIGSAHGDGQIRLGLPSSESRVLIVSDAISPISEPELLDELLIGEKVLVSFGNVKVLGLTRITYDPYQKAWQRSDAEAFDPMGQALDLSVDEIGPHDQPGQYKRSWIVQYQTANGLSQRQFDGIYSVGTILKKVRSDKFFRRVID